MKTWEVFRLNYFYKIFSNGTEKSASSLAYFIPIGFDYEIIGNVIGFVSIKRSTIEEEQVGVSFFDEAKQRECDIILRKKSLVSLEISKLNNPLGVIPERQRQRVLGYFFNNKNIASSIAVDHFSTEELIQIHKKFDQGLFINNEINVLLKIISKKVKDVEEINEKIENLQKLCDNLLLENNNLLKKTKITFKNMWLRDYDEESNEKENDLKTIRDSKSKIAENYRVLKLCNLQIIDFFEKAVEVRNSNHKIYESIIEKFKEIEEIIANFENEFEVQYLRYSLNIDDNIFDQPNYWILELEANAEMKAADSYHEKINHKNSEILNYSELIENHENIKEYEKLLNRLIK